MGRDWSSRDWAACWFIKALKGKPVNGYAFVPLPGNRRAFLDGWTARYAPRWFAEIAVSCIDWSRFAAPLMFVPIPDSSCGVRETTVPRTVRMATSLAARLGGGAVTADILRWQEAMPSSHRAGGTRDPHVLHDKLTLIASPPSHSRLMLIDDILASGGHLRAAAAFLSDHGTDVSAAICAGRADNECIDEDAFAFRMELLPDLERHADR